MSSRLLINEPPLQVLPSLAMRCGLNEAIVLQQVHYWLGMKSIGKEADGRKWVRNSVREWKEQNFPFWHENTVARAIASLVKQGVLLQRNDLSDTPLDRSLWYSIDYRLLNAFHQNGGMEDTNLVECSIYTETTTETTKEIVLAEPKPAPVAPKKKPASTAYVNPDTGTSTTAIMEAYKKLLPAGTILNHAQENAAAQALAKAGWTPAQVEECYKHMKKDPFWKSKHLALWSLAKQIGEYHARNSRSSGFTLTLEQQGIFLSAEPINPDDINF